MTDDILLRRERLLGNIQGAKAQIQNFEVDEKEFEKRYLSNLAQLQAHRRSIEAIHNLHAHLQKEEAMEDIVKNHCHEWVDRSRLSVESQMTSPDLDMKMCKGVILYIQGQIQKLNHLVSELKKSMSDLDSELKESRIVGTHPEPPLKVQRTSKPQRKIPAKKG